MGEFSPALRILARIGSRVHLRGFEFYDWIDGSTPLIDFLATQPGLESLTCIDVPRGRPLVLPPEFLPALSVIESSIHTLPRILIQSRPIKSVLISSDPVFRHTVSDHLDALSGSTAPIEALGMVPNHVCSTDDVLYIYGQFAARLPELKELRTSGFTFGPYAFDVLRPFHSLGMFSLQSRPCVQYCRWVQRVDSPGPIYITSCFVLEPRYGHC